MTDITELAQILKAAAEKWQEAWGKYDKVEITIAEFIRAAEQYESIVKDPANIRALVEALEKAQHEARVDWEAAASLNVENQELKRRIAELEGAEQKLCAANVTLDARAELAERQLAEMGSRTVTVKLSSERFRYGESDYDDGYVNGWNARMAEDTAALDRVGIKWEAE